MDMRIFSSTRKEVEQFLIRKALLRLVGTDVTFQEDVRDLAVLASPAFYRLDQMQGVNRLDKSDIRQHHL